MEKLVVILLCLSLFSHGQTLDETLQPGANGEDVVDAVIDKIRSECILIDDKYLMRRIAAVETDFGFNSNPMTGGIWKINGADLNDVRTQCQSGFRTMCNIILQSFKFDVSQATMMQMDIPLYSALIMYLRIANLGNRGRVIPASASDQAQFWINNINSGGDKNDFIAKSSIKTSCSAVKMELVFAIDASGSVGSKNFQKTLSFLKSVVQDLQIGSDMTRVAVVRFESSPVISFDLDTYNNKQDIINNISSINYTGGSTRTSYAIDLARTSVFRHARKNVPKVFVLITDGRSHSQTVSAADELKNDTVTIFTIGIGSVNTREMLAVASPPSCTHFFSLSSYSEIDAIISEIQRESCMAPVTVNTNSLNDNKTDMSNNSIPSDNSTKVQNIAVEPDTTNQNTTTNTTTVKVVVVCGTVNIYGANGFKPNPAFYTFKAVAKDGTAGWIRSPANKKLFLSLLSQKRLDLVLSECVKPHYNISFNPSDQGVTVICREDGKERPCTSDDIKITYGSDCGDDNIPNPCTRDNILKNKIRFEHPKSPDKYIQCKPSGQMEIVKCPTGTQYDVSQKVCGPQIMSPSQNSSLYMGPNPCTTQAIMKGQFYFENPSDNSTFIQCDEWGYAFLVPCPNNTIWSQQAYTCVHQFSAISPMNKPCKSRQNNDPFYYENPNNRKSFIQCDTSGNAYMMPCPLGTVWSQANLTCVHDSMQLGLSIHPNSEYNSTPPPTPTNVPTQCKFGAFLPHADPHKYNICGWKGALTEMSCPGALVWDQDKKVCNWSSGSSVG